MHGIQTDRHPELVLPGSGPGFNIPAAGKTGNDNTYRDNNYREMFHEIISSIVFMS
jgi:hypothetical protein